MKWTALVPLKPPGSRKVRLSERLSPEERERLSQHLFVRTVETLRSTPAVRAIHLVSAERPVKWMDGWSCDQGRGLNPELEAARLILGGVPLLVIHADLPLVMPHDVAALLRHAAMYGCAIAPDRHGEGTNAVAIMPERSFRFAFGLGSRALHQDQVGPQAVFERPALALDCDTSEDLDRAVREGFVLPR